MSVAQWQEKSEFNSSKIHSCIGIKKFKCDLVLNKKLILY